MLSIEQEAVFAVGGASGGAEAVSGAGRRHLSWSFAALAPAEAGMPGAGLLRALQPPSVAAPSLAALATLVPPPERLPRPGADDGVLFSAWDAENADVAAATAADGAGVADGGRQRGSAVGVRGASSEPGGLVTYGDASGWGVAAGGGGGAFMPLLAVSRLSGCNAGARASEDEVAVMAHGTFPLLRLPSSASPAAVCAAPHLGSLALLRGLQLTLVSSPQLARSAPALPRAVTLLTHGDACVRHMHRAAGYAAQEWATLQASMRKSLATLELRIQQHHIGTGSVADLRATAVAFYPSAPAPLASAELFRVLAVGATSEAVGYWLQTAVDDAAVARLLRGVDTACTALEALAVTHMARAGETLLLAASELRAVASPAIDTNAARDEAAELAALGVRATDLAALEEEAAHLLALLQVVRAAVLHARRAYTAVLLWWRGLFADVDAHSADTEAAEAADAVKPKARRSRAQPLDESDMALVRAAFQPASTPDLQAATAASASGSNVAAAAAPAASNTAADPLGLGFATSISEQASADPLGLGFGSGGGLQEPAAAAQAAAFKVAAQAREVHDVLLPFSLTDLISGREFATVGQATSTPERSLARLAALPPAMASYSAAAGPWQRARRCATLGEQLLALDSRWRTVCAAPAARMAADASELPIAALSAPEHATSTILAAVARSVTVAFDDGAGWGWPEGASGQCAVGGSYVIALPLPPGLQLAAAEPARLTTSSLLLLRATSAAPFALAAAVVSLPSGASVLGTAYYGPPPGALAVASAAAAAAGTGYVVKPTVASADKRAMVLLCHAASLMGGETSSGSDRGDQRLWLATLPYRRLTFTPLGEAGSEAAVAALAAVLGDGHEAAWHALADVAPRVRDLNVPLPRSAPHERGGDPLEQWAAWALACDMDVAGPRGVGIVLVGGRKLMVFDLEEDEEPEEEEADEESEPEDGGDT
jgi:hypothetical protein